jgi:peptidyl-prolyl cis-trans isomerase A (cyclophilin A)
MLRTLVAVFSLLASFSVGAAGPQVEIKTSMGAITVELYPDKAPETVKNFMQYARDRFYDGTIFHRVIDGFMIQGGGFTPDLAYKPARAPIRNEASNGLRNDVGTIAMARTSDPHSATAQFFINVSNNEALNYPGQDGYGYAVFGKVVKGMDVVDRIKQVPTAARPPHQNVPATPVIIQSVRIVGAPAKKSAK